MMLADEDLYGDLPEDTTSDHIDKLESRISSLNEQVKELTSSLSAYEQEKVNLATKLDVLKQEKETLLWNISSVFKTARAELARKAKTIEELRTELENRAFRRRHVESQRNNPIENVELTRRQTCDVSNPRLRLQEFRKYGTDECHHLPGIHTTGEHSIRKNNELLNIEVKNEPHNDLPASVHLKSINRESAVRRNGEYSPVEIVNSSNKYLPRTETEIRNYGGKKERSKERETGDHLKYRDQEPSRRRNGEYHPAEISHSSNRYLTLPEHNVPDAEKKNDRSKERDTSKPRNGQYRRNEAIPSSRYSSRFESEALDPGKRKERFRDRDSDRSRSREYHPTEKIYSSKYSTRFEHDLSNSEKRIERSRDRGSHENTKFRDRDSTKSRNSDYHPVEMINGSCNYPSRVEHELYSAETKNRSRDRDSNGHSKFRDRDPGNSRNNDYYSTETVHISSKHLNRIEHVLPDHKKMNKRSRDRDSSEHSKLRDRDSSEYSKLRDRDSSEHSKFRDCESGKPRSSDHYPAEMVNSSSKYSCHPEPESSDYQKNNEYSKDRNSSGRSRRSDSECSKLLAEEKKERRSRDSVEFSKYNDRNSGKRKSTDHYQAEMNNNANERPTSEEHEWKDTRQRNEHSSERLKSRIQEPAKSNINDCSDLVDDLELEELKERLNRRKTELKNLEEMSGPIGACEPATYTPDKGLQTVANDALTKPVPRTDAELRTTGKRKVYSEWFRSEQCTPLKLMNNELPGFPLFPHKLVSPIADTPDHIKEKLKEYSNYVKVSPVPMLNERRALENWKPVSLVEENISQTEAIAKLADVNDVSTPDQSSNDNPVSISPIVANDDICNTDRISDEKSIQVADSMDEINRLRTPDQSSDSKSVPSSAVVIDLNDASTSDGTSSTKRVSISTDVEHGVFKRRRRKPPVS